ncbi:MAG: hypothetical protein HYU83_06185, partial [Chloroflexi bacterium]|nr:hypothetical protein [Chloroflexota bacterium]
MADINVVLASRLEPELQQQVAAVSKRYKVHDAADLFEAALPGAPQASNHPELDGLLREAEVLLMPRAPWPTGIFSQTPKLKWVQYIGAGVDSAAVKGLLKENFITT